MYFAWFDKSILWPFIVILSMLWVTRLLKNRLNRTYRTTVWPCRLVSTVVLLLVCGFYFLIIAEYYPQKTELWLTGTSLVYINSTGEGTNREPRGTPVPTDVPTVRRWFLDAYFEGPISDEVLDNLCELDGDADRYQFV